MKLLNVNANIAQQYKSEVKGNAHTSRKQIRAKLTRNVALAKELQFEEGVSLYMYGKLWMLVRDNTVVWIRNNQPLLLEWEKDINKYVELSKELGIRD